MNASLEVRAVVAKPREEVCERATRFLLLCSSVGRRPS
jgi:hypothetical protein